MPASTSAPTRTQTQRKVTSQLFFSFFSLLCATPPLALAPPLRSERPVTHGPTSARQRPSLFCSQHTSLSALDDHPTAHAAAKTTLNRRMNFFSTMNCPFVTLPRDEFFLPSDYNAPLMPTSKSGQHGRAGRQPWLADQCSCCVRSLLASLCKQVAARQGRSGARRILSV